MMPYLLVLIYLITIVKWGQPMANSTQTGHRWPAISSFFMHFVVTRCTPVAGGGHTSRYSSVRDSRTHCVCPFIIDTFSNFPCRSQLWDCTAGNKIFRLPNTGDCRAPVTVVGGQTGPDNCQSFNIFQVSLSSWAHNHVVYIVTNFRM